MIIDELKTKFPFLELRVRNIGVNKSKKIVECLVCVRTNDDDVAQNIKDEIVGAVRSIVPSSFKCKTTVIADRPTDLEVKRFVMETLRKQFPIVANVSAEKIVVQIAQDTVQIVLNVSQTQYDLLETIEFADTLQKLCNDFTSLETLVTVSADKSTHKYTLKDQEKLIELAVSREMLKPERYFSVSNVIACVGKLITTRPMYISDIREPLSRCTICGKLSDKTFSATKNDSNLLLLKFTLEDLSDGKISCVMFVRLKSTDVETISRMTGKPVEEAQKTVERNRAYNDRAQKKIMRLCNGDDVVVDGKIVKSEYSGKFEMQLYDICKCNIDVLSAQPVFVKPVPAEYSVLQPTRFEEYKQLSLTEVVNKNKGYLTDKKYVVMYVNATDYSYINGRIFALSCAKIEKGRLTEKLFSYVNPDVPLSDKHIAEAKAEHGAFSFSRTLTEIIGDVYKFCYGYTLLGENIEKVVEMLNYFANPVGYNFDNNVIPIDAEFSQMFDLKWAHKKPNCAVLKDVAKSCGIAVADDLSFCRDKTDVATRCIFQLAKQIDPD